MSLSIECYELLDMADRFKSTPQSGKSLAEVPRTIAVAGSGLGTTSSSSLCCSFLWTLSFPVAARVQAIGSVREAEEAASTVVDAARTGVDECL